MLLFFNKPWRYVLISLFFVNRFFFIVTYCNFLLSLSCYWSLQKWRVKICDGILFPLDPKLFSFTCFTCSVFIVLSSLFENHTLPEPKAQFLFLQNSTQTCYCLYICCLACSFTCSLFLEICLVFVFLVFVYLSTLLIIYFSFCLSTQ